MTRTSYHALSPTHAATATGGRGGLRHRRRTRDTSDHNARSNLQCDHQLLEPRELLLAVEDTEQQRADVHQRRHGREQPRLVRVARPAHLQQAVELVGGLMSEVPLHELRRVVGEHGDEGELQGATTLVVVSHSQ